MESGNAVDFGLLVAHRAGWCTISCLTTSNGDLAASRHFSLLDFWFPALSRKFTIRPFSWTEFCPVAVVSHGCLRSFCPVYLLTLFVATTTFSCLKFAFICCLPTCNYDSCFVIWNTLLACFVFMCWVLTGSHHDCQPLTIFWMSFLFVNDDFHCFLLF